jgi:hypothetical protein
MGVVNVQFETKHTSNYSSQIELFYFSGQFFGITIPFNGFGLTYNLRYYLKGDYPKGLFIQPFGRFQQYNLLPNQSSISSASGLNNERIKIYSSGMVIGYQFIFARRISFDFFAGPSYNITYANGIRTTAIDTGPFFNGGWMRIGSTLGFAF